jgi:LmbE family N-acetylglucosaminyl deacetylase
MPEPDTGEIQIVKIAVLSPHRDDAAFSVSLAIDAWVGQGHKVEIIDCFTRSEYAPYSDADSVHPNDRISYVTALRQREDEIWRRQFGDRVTLVDLNLKDAPLRLHCSLDDVCSVPVSLTDKVVSKIQKALERSAASAWVLPLGIGNHVDHLTARDIALTPGFLSGSCAFYEDLPYASRPGAADAIHELAHAVESDLTEAFASDVNDVNNAVSRKRRLALCYDSQIDDEITDQIAAFSSQYQGRERLWVNAAWRASQLMFPGTRAVTAER